MPTDAMSADEFRRYGKQLIDWIADYWQGLEDVTIQPDIEPGEIRAMLPAAAPEAPEPFDAVIADLDAVVARGLVHWQSPHWFAYFPANASFPAILAELVSAGLGQQGMLWSTSPVTTEIESHVLDWLVDLLGLPAHWKTTGPGGGVIQMSASDASHIALVVARHRAAAGNARPHDMVAYTSSQAHSSIEKGARVAGYGHIRPINVDAQFGMLPDALAAAIDGDLSAGLTPAFVGSTIGTTGTTAIDPIRAIGEVAQSNGLWHHVDAAFAGTAMLCDEFRHHQDGLELVDSYNFNPHKWMLTNFDCSVLYVADRRPLIEVLEILPPYLKNRASQVADVIDYRDWHIPLGRRFRALKLWWVLRTYGASGLRALIREHVRLARWLDRQLMDDDRFEVVAPTPFSLVSFRHVSGDSTTQSLASEINREGPAYVTASSIDGMHFIRVSIGQTNTREAHVQRLWQTLDRLAPPV
ncbi:MAG: pyridoxal-dependent decarboxylase [Acidimicrobiia bacterium]|nr:pyridoxal-dependent decarboxylase [Acidimicrobiia bacterium]